MENILIMDVNGVFTSKKFNRKDMDFLTACQQAVGGYIESLGGWFPQFDEHHICVYVNEEGILQSLKPSLAAINNTTKEFISAFYGNVVFVGYNEDYEFCSLNEEQVRFIRNELDKKICLLCKSGERVVVNSFCTDISREEIC